MEFICVLAYISCSHWLITARSVTLAKASTLMRGLFRQQEAVSNALRSCPSIMPVRSSLWCNEAQVASNVSWVYDNWQA